MAALNPNVIRDTKKLVSLYQTNDRFCKAFDTVTAKNINATYKNRPIKLYVEILAGVSSEYKRDSDQVRRIPLHDKEGKVGELFRKVKPNDFFLLDAVARAAEQGSNTTTVPPEEVEQINKIETEKTDRREKKEAYIQREASAEEKNPPEQTETQAPAPTPTPVSLPGIPEVRNWSGRARSVRQVFTNPRQFVQSFFSRGVSSTATRVGVKTVSEGVIKTVSTRAGARFAGGRVVAAGIGKTVSKLGVGTGIRLGAGLAAKVGISVAAGVLTGGVSLAIQAAAMLLTNPKAVKNLLRYILWIVIAVFILLFMGSSTNRGIKMNSLLPPYPIGGNAGVPEIPPVPLTPTPSASITPSPPNIIGCSGSNNATFIKDVFGITMIGFSHHSLELACLKFSSINISTRFIDLVRGSIIQTASGGSQQVSCPGDSSPDVYLQQFSDDDLFNVILIHELSHVVRNCNSRTNIMYDQHLQVLAAEGPLTSYAANAYCTGSDTQSEDYAEMLAYYLNINSPSRTAACAPDTQGNPYSGGRHPLHYQLVQLILRKSF